jgi:hypothetical protein
MGINEFTDFIYLSWDFGVSVKKESNGFMYKIWDVNKVYYTKCSQR